MPVSISEKNTFRRWLDKFRAETDILREHAIDGPIEEIADDFARSVSKWDQLFNHAARYDIDLQEFAEQTSAIEKNLTKIESIVKKRQGNPLLAKIIPPILFIADKIDNVLVGLGRGRIVRPVAETFLGLIGWFTKKIAPPTPVLLLTAPNPPLESIVTVRSSGSIESVWVEHNVFENDQKGMRIHTKFTVNHLVNIQCEISVYFYFRDGTKLKDTNNAYNAADGQVATGSKFVPFYEGTSYNDYPLFMPSNEFHLPDGKYNCKFFVALYNHATQSTIITSNFFEFLYSS